MQSTRAGGSSTDSSLLWPLAAAHAGLYLALLPPAVVTLALHVQQVDPQHQVRTLSLMLAIGAAGGLLSQNLAGASSDRTTSRYGMRRPWILAGACGGALSLVALAAASSAWVLVLAWAGTVMSYNAMQAGLGPLLAEHFTANARGRAAGLIGVMPAFAGLVGVAIVAGLLPSVTLALIVPALLGLLGTGWLLLRVPDRRLPKGDAPAWETRDLVRAFWVNPRAHPDFAWAWLSRMLVLLGAAALVSYRPYFLQDTLTVATGEVADVILRAGVLSTIAAVVCGPLSGRLSDRLRQRKNILVGAGLVLAAMHAVTALTSSLTVFYAASALAGAALGCYLAVDLALITEVLPSEETTGKDMGVVHLATALPQFVVPILAQPLLGAGNDGSGYRTLYICAALAGAIGALMVLRVRAVR